jgi:hypothetical protein
MNDKGSFGEAARDYAVAYAAHYSQRDLPSALHLYTRLIVSHERTPESGYSISQVQNIVKSLVPAQELLDAQVGLALACLEQRIPLDGGPIPVAPIAPESTE